MATIPAQYLRSSHAAEPRTLLDVFDAAATRHPDAPCIDDGTRVLSYDEVARTIHTSARWMHDQGVVAGDRVGIHMPSGSADLYLAILSTLAAGA
ncbi:MAG: AMP-binding protein, partial [Dietzia maris]